MPFSNITILLAEDDIALRALWESVCTEIGFKVIAVSTVNEGLEYIAKADIFIVDLVLADGDASLLISAWERHNGGPMLCVSGIVTADKIREYILRGADNAFEKTVFTTEMLRTLVTKYAKRVLLLLRLDNLEKKVKLQQRAIAGLAILVVGKDLWEWLSPLIF